MLDVEYGKIVHVRCRVWWK